ncbi:MAG: hypothetical protein JW737_03435 [Acidobacteria bacterium]|nr:hypothetical protein [Acidobacteriota bacterium]
MIKIRMLLIAVVAMALAVNVSAESNFEFDIEGGWVSSGYNDVRIPNEGGTLFSLSEDLSIDSKAYFRLRASYWLGERHVISALYAPLSFDAYGILPGDIHFNGTDFPGGSEADGFFMFNSYRLTYRYMIVKNEDIQFGIGFTGKIRDAEISVDAAGLYSSKTNVGFVPLLNLYLKWNWSENFGLLIEADAAAAKQGRAEDVLTALFYKLNDNMTLKAGYRFVEGGADVDEVYNFAWIHYAAAGIIFSF